jgi:glycosyltransferase involved in cell wall biosynthesis
MKFSIITVVYNAVATIADTVCSVANQRYRDIEYIVIDGSSTDGTLTVLEGLREHITTLVSEPDRGIYDAMNKGIVLAIGDIIGFLNADDMYADDAVIADVEICFRDPDVDACYADLVYVDPYDTDRVLRYWKSREYKRGLFKKGWMPAHPTFFVRRSVYQRLGGFDLDYRLQSDFELTMRFLHVHRIRAVYLPRVLVKMRMGGVTNRSMWNIISGNIEAYRAARKHKLGVSWLFMIRKVMSRLPQFLARPRN